MRFTALACSCLVFCMTSLVVAGEQDVKSIPPSEAAKMIDQKCTVEMKVASTGKGGGGVFLNSKENYRDDGNFTIYIKSDGVESFKQAKIDDIGSHFNGKTVLVTGTVSLYQMRPQIIVEKAEQVRLAEKK
jgi:DNA/RNA endonuclease YhcR with UshA esterase domain